MHVLLSHKPKYVNKNNSVYLSCSLLTWPPYTLNHIPVQVPVPEIENPATNYLLPSGLMNGDFGWCFLVSA